MTASASVALNYLQEVTGRRISTCAVVDEALCVLNSLLVIGNVNSAPMIPRHSSSVTLEEPALTSFCRISQTSSVH